MIHLLFRNDTAEVQKLLASLEAYFGSLNLSSDSLVASENGRPADQLSSNDCVLCLLDSLDSSSGGLAPNTKVDIRELEAVLASDAVTIPVLMNEFQMPSPETMPKTVRKLAYSHALPLRKGEHFQTDFARLLRDLESHTGIRRKPIGPWGIWMMGISTPFLIFFFPFICLWYFDAYYWTYGYEVMEQFTRSAYVLGFLGSIGLATSAFAMAIGFRLRLLRQNSKLFTKYLRGEISKAPNKLSVCFSLATPLLAASVGLGLWTLVPGMLLVLVGSFRACEVRWPQWLLVFLGVLATILLSWRDSTLDSVGQAVARFEAGTILLVDNQLAEAEAAYKESLSSWPRFGNGHLGLARIHKQQNNTTEAIYELNRAIDLYPTDSRGWYEPQKDMVAEAFDTRADLLESEGNIVQAAKDRGMADAMIPFLDLFSGLGRFWELPQVKEYDRYSNSLQSRQPLP